MGERFLITGKDRPTRTGPNGLEHHRGKNLGCFVIVIGPEVSTILVAPGSHSCVFYSDEEKGKLCELIKLKEVGLPRKCVLLKHGNVEHAGGEWERIHGLHDHLCLIYENANLKDAVTFMYVASMQRAIQNNCKVLLGEVHPLYLSDEKESADDKVSRNMATVKVLGGGTKVVLSINGLTT